MPKANEIKRGQVIEHDGAVYTVRQIDRSAPTARGATTLFRFKLQGVPGGERRELTLKGDDILSEAALTRRAATFSFRDADDFVFMDSEDFSQYILAESAVGDAAAYITEALDEVTVLLIDGAPAAIQMPQSVVLEVTETAPVMKGATATKSNKPAILENGVEVLVPDYVTPGEKIKVNTETGEFMGRA